jgi:HAE1 family hydrophobic/amphiphilic exporter-1
MNTATFIARPILANVIALLVSVAGLVAILFLPVAQYPPITPPTVQVTARFPGADARTVIDTVALPIEQQVNGVENMLYMQSTSANDGTYALTVTFAVGTDLDEAQVQVQNRLSAATALLPQAVQAQGVTTKKKSTAILQIVTLTSPDRSRDGLFLSNYATISLKDRLARIPGVADVSVFGAGQYGMRIWLDADTMRARGLMPGDVVAAVQQQSQAVAVQDDAAFRASPEAVATLTVRNATGGSVPVGVLAGLSPGLGPALVPLFNLAPSATITGAAAPGASSGEALELMARLARESLPPGIRYDWAGMSYQEAQLGAQAYGVFGLALLLVFLVLAGQYESWTAPLAVILAVPVALLGTVVALAAAGADNNIYTQVGLVLLIALAAKNAILVVAFARGLRLLTRGLGIEEAALAAGRLRLRPILMTSLAFVLGVLPLVFASGAGAAAQRSIGLTVCSGMLASTFVAVLFVPPLFVVLQRWSERGRTATGQSRNAPAPGPATPMEG